MLESDAQVVTRILEGDSELYRVLVDRHKDRCYRYARRMLCDEDATDDVLQETFVRAYRSLHQCADLERFSAWLFQILVNRCRSALSAKSIRESRLDRTVSNESMGSTNPEVWASDEFAHLDWAMQKLPVPQREALSLKYLQELTYEEMSALTGVSIPALKMRVSRACDVLRITINESGVSDV